MKNIMYKILILFSVILISSCSLFTKEEENKWPENGVEKIQIQGNELELHDIEDNQTENIDENTDEVELQNQADELIEKGDLDACKGIEDEIYRGVCKNNIILERVKIENVFF